jgi:hypothetical protein
MNKNENWNQDFLFYFLFWEKGLELGANQMLTDS